MNLEKTKRILVVMGHLFDSGSPFFLLPKELTSVITTLTYFNFAIVKNITKKGGSSPFYLDESRSDPIFSLNSHNGGMATAQCEMDSKDEVIVWEVRCFLFIINFPPIFTSFLNFDSVE